MARTPVPSSATVKDRAARWTETVMVRASASSEFATSSSIACGSDVTAIPLRRRESARSESLTMGGAGVDDMVKAATGRGRLPGKRKRKLRRGDMEIHRSYSWIKNSNHQLMLYI